jgi:hypothetical protein
MGISKLLPHLPRGREKQTRFIHCKHLVAGQKLDIDAGTLIFTCALEHRETFNQGIYKPAVTSFLGKLVVLRTAYEWDFTIVFDGLSPPEKAPEHARRDRKKDEDGNVIITPLFVGMCI